MRKIFEIDDRLGTPVDITFCSSETFELEFDDFSIEFKRFKFTNCG